MTPATWELAGRALTERVSHGNFCDVWRAGAEAVKVATTPVGERMLAAEMEAVRQLTDVTGVLQPVAHGTAPAHYLVLPWIDGGSFRDLLERSRGGDGRARALQTLVQLVGTISEVHHRGLVHGDLKPENVLLTGGGHPRLTDFGLAREKQSARRGQSLCHSMRSEEGLIGGTMAYLSPEQVKGAEPSQAGDVYALGVMLHEVLLGRRPDKALGAEALRPLLPDSAIEVLLRALAFHPDDRYRSAGAMLQDLRRLSGLAVTGPARWLRASGRFLLAGLAAFFITLRYGAVLGLVAAYCWLLIAGLTRNPAILLGFLPIAAIHAVVRWEGPESAEEAKLRRSGGVVSR